MNPYGNIYVIPLDSKRTKLEWDKDASGRTENNCFVIDKSMTFNFGKEEMRWRYDRFDPTHGLIFRFVTNSTHVISMTPTEFLRRLGIKPPEPPLGRLSAILGG